MSDKNNRRENTFKRKQTEPEIEETTPSIVEETEEKKGKKKDSTGKEKKTKAKEPKTTKEPKEAGRVQKIIGILFICLAIFLGIALISYLVNFFSGHYQEIGVGQQIFDQQQQTDNLKGSGGVFLAQTLIKESFGIGAFFFVYLLTIIGLRLTETAKFKMWNVWKWALLGLVWLPLFFGFISQYAPSCSILGGAVGKWLNDLLTDYIGNAGVIIILAFLFLVFIIYQFNLTLNYFKRRREMKEEEARRQAAILAEQRIKEQWELENQNMTDGGEDIDPDSIDDEEDDEDETLPPATATTKDPTFVIVNPDETGKQQEGKENVFIDPKPDDTDDKDPVTPTDDSGKTDSDADDVELVIENTSTEKTVDEGKNMEHHTIDTPFDPRYELRDYQFPTLDMLNDYGGGKSEIDEEELNANKNKIVETLGNYGIAIDKIKATIGPTVALYEIVPAAGVRISKIKNLEDDIALSLAALGIRIIAPIPGKGTVGIEVPNSQPKIVPMREMVTSEKFLNAKKMALPIAIGRTISNEVFVFDLAKTPHVLMAGATGQGKSVGLNAVLTSLLYYKHPSELKLVLVDPKKVELTLYSKIERHYLAKLPDAADAIITDTSQVVRTLNSLCIEMDNRYELLKKAQCRNIIEYNEKFCSRHLNPEHGHRYLPYIVLIFDEFADCIMTAGREVESPVARLAQLARAIGIHLIVATQRPSVNIITGVIKANFPARIAFRVSSSVDSRTILDTSGAERLIGKGDMLISLGGEVTRIQCALVDTPEIERICDYIGEQHAFTHAYLLPEVPEDTEESTQTSDDGEIDSCFADAARVVVLSGHGSTSLLQRKLKLGYNRAGRVMDQLEREGIVGAFEGSKAREVLVKDPAVLENKLKEMGLA